MESGSLKRRPQSAQRGTAIGFAGALRFLGFFLGGAGGRVVGDDQALGVGRLLVHRYTQVVEGGYHHFQRFGVDQLVRQVVGDFAVCQVAAGLAQLDQGFQALAAFGLSRELPGHCSPLRSRTHRCA